MPCQTSLCESRETMLPRETNLRLISERDPESRSERNCDQETRRASNNQRNSKNRRIM